MTLALRRSDERQESRSDQRVARRRPRQVRSFYKVELMLEAAMQLLDEKGPAALTTGAVALRAGVSIGTLYQYFANKGAIIDALADREMAMLSERVLSVLRDEGATTPAERVPRIIDAVMSRYGRRRKVHGMVLEHSLKRGGRRMPPLLDDVIARTAAGGGAQATDHARAFVATHTIAGVLRAMVRSGDAAPPSDEVERALTRMLTALHRRD